MLPYTIHLSSDTPEWACKLIVGMIASVLIGLAVSEVRAWLRKGRREDG